MSQEFKKGPRGGPRARIPQDADMRRLIQLCSYLVGAIYGERFSREEYEQWVGEIADLGAKYSSGSIDDSELPSGEDDGDY